MEGEFATAVCGEGGDVGEPSGGSGVGELENDVEEVLIAFESEGGGIVAQGEKTRKKGTGLRGEGRKGGRNNGGSSEHESIMIDGRWECKGVGREGDEKRARLGSIGRFGAQKRSSRGVDRHDTDDQQHRSLEPTQSTWRGALALL